MNNLYLNHFGLAEAPYRITPHTDFFFEGANRGTTLDALVYTITHDEGIVKVTGEVGSGKTMLCRVLMERLPQNVETIYLANPSLGRDEIMMAISDDAGVESLAGIMGGEVSGCTEATTDVFLESAFWDPITIAATGPPG